MTLSTVKEYVYMALDPHGSEETGVEKQMKMVEAQLNVMQTVFLVIETSSSLEAGILEKGMDIFHLLFNRYFTVALGVHMLESVCNSSFSREIQATNILLSLFYA